MVPRRSDLMKKYGVAPQETEEEVRRPPLAGTAPPAGPKRPAFKAAPPPPPPPPPRQHAAAREGEIPGAFGGRGPGGTRPSVRREWVPSPELRRLMERLPPLWGIDLALLILTVIGLIAIALNWSVVMLALARMVYSAANVLIQLLLLLILVAVGLLIFRGRG